MKLRKLKKQLQANNDFKTGQYYYQNHKGVLHRKFKSFLLWFKKNVYPRYNLDFLDEPMDKDESF